MTKENAYAGMFRDESVNLFKKCVVEIRAVTVSCKNKLQQERRIITNGHTFLYFIFVLYKFYLYIVHYRSQCVANVEAIRVLRIRDVPKRGSWHTPKSSTLVADWSLIAKSAHKSGNLSYLRLFDFPARKFDFHLRLQMERARNVSASDALQKFLF